MKYGDCSTKAARIAHIKHQLANNDKWMLKGLVTIYSYQTESEKAVNITQEDNGVGFNGPDSEILSSFAKFYMSAGFLTAKQLIIARRRMIKYARQLDGIAQRKLVK